VSVPSRIFTPPCSSGVLTCMRHVCRCHSRTIHQLSHDEASYLESCSLSENDPGVVFNWHDASVAGFVAAANAPLPAGIVVPPWVQRPLQTR
jgi:hypothetical protein